MNKSFRSVIVLALIMCTIMVCTLIASASDDAIIYTAEDISSEGRIVSVTRDAKYGQLTGGNVIGNYKDGVVRFVSTNPGAVSTAGDRLIIEVDSINLTEYPYVAVSYKTNIDAPNLNFNLTTDGGEYTHDAKLFFAQTRTAGKDAIGTGKYDGAYGTNAVATSVYIPLWSNTGKATTADDYFDVEYIGFFKTEKAMKAYKYTPGEIKVNIQLVEQVQRLLVGDSFKLTATTTIEGQAIPAVTFESDNDAVASVTADGTITAKSAGVATITAKSSANESTCKVYVLAEKLAPVEFARKTGMKVTDLPVVNCLGDSITTYAPGPDAGKNFHDWWAADYYIKNNDYGISGASLSANGKEPFVNRYMNMSDDADLIVVKGGTNDFSTTGVGSMTTRATSTMAGSLRVLMEGLIDKYPEKQIVFFTPIKRCEGGQTPATTNKFGNTLNDFANTVIEMGKIYNIPVIDLYTPEELDFTSTLISAAGHDASGKWHDAVCESDLMPDGLHPSGKGHTIIASYTLDKLQELGVVEVTDGKRLDTAFIKGYDGNLFKPDNNMTRAEACAVVTRVMTSEDRIKGKYKTKYADVKEGAWYYDYVAYLDQFGYLYSFKGDFKPDQPITRAEFVELVYRMGKVAKTDKEISFTDVPETHERYDVIMAAAKSGLVNGKTATTFDPDGRIKRSEVVKVLCAALGRTPTKEAITAAGVTGFADVAENHWAYPYIVEAAREHKCTLDANGNEIWIEVNN